MFRFAILVLAGIAVGAVIFGGAGSAAAGVGFFALFPLLLLAKLVFIAMIFGLFARRGYGSRWRTGEFRSFWDRDPSGSRGATKDERQSETDRFEQWHRMAHAREEVDSWVPEPE
ncbi:MAG: hypothetical protein IZT58_14275 [Actinobacteria bacterium]|nr:hypothetical protein [Actinomycetota bacterium]